MSDYAIVAVAAFGFLIVLLIAWAAHSSWRQAQERRRAILDLGFVPVEQPDPAIVNRIEDICRDGICARAVERGLWLRHMFERTDGDCRIRLFDIWSQGRHRNCVAGNAVSMTSPRLDLPRFSLVPRLDMGGALAAIANRMMESLAPPDMVRVSVPDVPEFERRYSLYAKEDSEALRAFTDSTVRRLCEMDGSYHVEASGDTLMYHRSDMHGPQRARKDDRDPQDWLVDDQKRLLDIFRIR